MYAIKNISRHGQISLGLGKQYAGRQAAVDELEPGVWVVKVGDFIPASERWFHKPEVAEQLDRSLHWAAEHPPADTDLDELERRIGEG